MLWQNSYIIWSFLCLLTLDQIHVSSELACKPGEKVSLSGNRCEPCPAEQYNSKHTESNECQNCDPCELNSDIVSACTATTNTKCRCLPGFKPLDKTQKKCICGIGSGIKQSENEGTICEQCPPGTFTDKINSKCQQLPQCIQSNEKFPGNGSADANCGNRVKPSTSTTPMTPTTNKSPVTTTTSRNSIFTPTTSSIPRLHENRNHALWLASFVAFLLLMLILKLSGCLKKRREIVREGSKCGRPVEESGEKLVPPV